MMGAETTVFVKVRKTYTEWIEVSAVTQEQAESRALDYPGVITVIDSSYDPPKEGRRFP